MWWQIFQMTILTSDIVTIDTLPHQYTVKLFVILSLKWLRKSFTGNRVVKVRMEAQETLTYSTVQYLWKEKITELLNSLFQCVILKLHNTKYISLQNHSTWHYRACSAHCTQITTWKENADVKQIMSPITEIQSVWIRSLKRVTLLSLCTLHMCVYCVYMSTLNTCEGNR